MTSDLESQQPNSLREYLPGYVNGTASVAERKAVDDALKNDPELRRELKELQNIAAAFVTREEISTAHSDGLFQRIKGNIAATSVKKVTDVPVRREQNDPHNSWWTWLFGDPRLAWGVALAQLVVIAVLVGTNFNAREKTYDTLSAQPAARIGGIQLNIVFDAGAAQEDVNRTLQQFGLHYVDGPSAAGMIVVALPEDVSSAGPVLEKLRQSKAIRFVEPQLGQSR